MTLENIMLWEISQADITLTHFQEILRIIKFIKRERIVVTRCMESLYFTSADLSWDEEKILVVTVAK